MDTVLIKNDSQLTSKMLKGSVINAKSPEGVYDLSFICTFVFTCRPLLLFGGMTLYAHVSSTTVMMQFR